eukprot:scaffold56_cov80-Cylindrotheca_fusiformis.AAC.1
MDHLWVCTDLIMKFSTANHRKRRDFDQPLTVDTHDYCDLLSRDEVVAAKTVANMICLSSN